uniref:Uncharacterized protein n=1 Tax=Lepeophtheirus salmonis TaxID=72036 RepID=A0A0K2VD26_LEPSM
MVILKSNLVLALKQRGRNAHFVLRGVDQAILMRAYCFSPFYRSPFKNEELLPTWVRAIPKK